jgi:uncharacterized membrane protein
MSIFGRARSEQSTRPDERPPGMADGLGLVLLGGRQTLEVVSEPPCQDKLWQLVRRRKVNLAQRVYVEISAVLLPEPENPYDAKAVGVWIDGLKVGYLSRNAAQHYQPGLVALQEKLQKKIALSGVIAGSGTGRLGVLLSHDPEDFGVGKSQLPKSARRDPHARRFTFFDIALIAVSMVLALIAAAIPGWHYFRGLHHHSVSWSGTIAIVSATLGLIVLTRVVFRFHGETSRTSPSGTSGNARTEEDGYPPDVQRMARKIKAVLQMAIGLYALGWLAWAFYLSSRIQNCAPPSNAVPAVSQQLCYFIPSASIIFQVIADALAAATAVQLVFTLFTPGPDEALDPALLALAAALLLQLGKVEKFNLEEGAAIVLYSVALGILFLVRIFLAPDEDKPPTLWWWKSRRR